MAHRQNWLLSGHGIALSCNVAHANLDRRNDEEILRFASALGLMLSTKRTMVRTGAGRTGDTAAPAVPLYVFTGDSSGGAEEEERRRTEDACAERKLIGP